MKHAAIAFRLHHAVHSLYPNGLYPLLRNFEERVGAHHTIPIVNYGSNSPDSLRETFRKAGVEPSIRFGGLVEIRNMRIAYGGCNKDGHPVATLVEDIDSTVTGWILLATLEQALAIAARECGSTLGRVPNKGHYRRAVLHVDDPRTNGQTKCHALVFVLRDSHPEVVRNRPASAKKVRERLGITRETKHAFNRYTKRVDAQRKAARELQAGMFEGEPPLAAYWRTR